MPGYIRVWVKMVIDFIFSISIIAGIASYALLGTVNSKKLQIIFAEPGTGENLTGNIIIAGNLPDYVIRNFLWYSIFIFIFCLIILYFMEPKLKVFLFPGTLCFLSVFFVQLVLMSINSFITPESPAAASDFVSLFFKQANAASLLLGLIGMILLIISCFNIYQIEKEKKMSL